VADTRVLAHTASGSSAPLVPLAVGLLVAVMVAALVVLLRSQRRPGGDGGPTRRAATILSAATFLVAGVALLTVGQWGWLLSDGDARSEGVSAPTLDPSPGETLYRITDGSSVSYEVEERLAGSTATARGVTDLVAGDIVVDRSRPAAARVGEIVVNVEAFESDSALRDKRIRHDHLESTEHPYARFVPTDVEGLPDDVVDGASHKVSITGDLTVKETTAPASFDGTVQLRGDRLAADVRATVRMSTYDVGPISVSGLVSTSDEVDLRLQLVAVETEPGEASEIAGYDESSTPPGAGSVSFAEQVQPILESRCASCHSSGGVGEETLPLVTAADAAEVADDLALVTGARYMPPWPASDRSPEFAHDWSLDDDEIAAIAAWARDGGGLDVPPATELRAEDSDVDEPERDHRIVGGAYSGDPERPDDYRCQIYELPGTAGPDRWLRGFVFEPDETEIVHHAIVSLAPASSRAAAEAADAADDGAGWNCSFGAAAGSLIPSSQLASWAPGQLPTEYPDGTGVRVAPGDFFIVQIHYHFDHEFPSDESALSVDLASPDELAAAGGQLDPVSYVTYLAPAEIPCSAQESGPLCDRGSVIQRIASTYGIGAALIPDGLLMECGTSLQAELADTDGVADSSCDTGVDNPGRIIGIFGHMHEFGASFRMTLNPGTPEERILLDIPTWSFDWQLDYRPVDDIVIDATDTIRVECTWDRALSWMPEPRHITWNEGTADEMCYSAIATVPP
jgi:polyisoprenoid-binding protein YceI